MFTFQRFHVPQEQVAFKLKWQSKAQRIRKSSPHTNTKSCPCSSSKKYLLEQFLLSTSSRSVGTKYYPTKVYMQKHMFCEKNVND